LVSQKIIDEVRKVYDQDPERIKKLAKFGDMFEKATAQVILRIIGEEQSI
jgi:hypothetical protein